MPKLSTKPHISVNNQGDHRICSEQFDFGSLTDYSVNAQAREDCFHSALVAPVNTGANTIFWCNTDRHETVPRYQAFRFMVRAGFGRTIKSDDTEAVCSRAAVQTPISNIIQIVSRPTTRRSSSPSPRLRSAALTSTARLSTPAVQRSARRTARRSRICLTTMMSPVPIRLPRQDSSTQQQPRGAIPRRLSTVVYDGNDTPY